MALIDDFKARFPEFDEQQVDERLPLVELTAPCFYGGDYQNACDREAILHLLAHLLVDELRTSTTGNKDTASKSVGSVSVSYTADTWQGGESWDFFKATKYGRRFMMLTQANSVGAFFV